MNPTLREEVKRTLPILLAKGKPPTREGLVRKMVRQAVVFGIADRAPAEWDTLLRVYYETLGDLSDEAIDEAFRAWGRAEMYPKEPGRHAFFPKPAEVFTLAQRAMREVQIATYRAKKALEHIERTEPRVKTPEDVAAIREMMAGFKVGLKAMPGVPRKSETPSQMADRVRAHEVETGPSGLSPLMRSRMGLGPERSEPEEPIL